MHKLAAIIGPTASGKTKLAVAVAEKLNGEIISADSQQIYTGMNIGTAKPSKDEICGIPHHMINIAEIGSSFSAVEFRDAAQKYIEDIAAKNKLPVLVGGTGLYFNSLVYPLSMAEHRSDAEIRARLSDEYDTDRERLYAKLKTVDPIAHGKLHINDKKRIIRAMEIYLLSGRPQTEEQNGFLAQSTANPNYKIAAVGIDFERAELYGRINRRVDMMLENGLLDEAREIYEKKYPMTLPAMQAIGYKQLYQYFGGELSLADAVDKIKMETRRYAKRQLTWFKRDKNITWIDGNCKFDELTKNAIEIIERKFGET